MINYIEYKTVTKHNRLGIEVFPNSNLQDFSKTQIKELKNLLWQHGVIVIKNQKLTASELKDFAKIAFEDPTLGNSPKAINKEIDLNLQSPGVVILGNPLGLDSRIIDPYTWQWHHDKDHLPRTEGFPMNSLYIILLYGIKIPPEDLNGKPHSTHFIDTIEAYNNLDAKLRQELENRSMYHLAEIKPEPGKKIPRKLQPIVSTHKVTGKKCLYLGSSSSILLGLENNLEEAKEYWSDLFENIIKVTPVYSYIWQAGDVLLWDNSQVIHTGIPYENTKHTRIALRVGTIAHKIDLKK